MRTLLQQTYQPLCGCILVMLMYCKKSRLYAIVIEKPAGVTCVLRGDGIHPFQ